MKPLRIFLNEFKNQETTVKFRIASVLTAALLRAGMAQAATELVIATVNNGHMIEMQKLSKNFEAANPDIKLKWVTLEEGVLRQRVAFDKHLTHEPHPAAFIAHTRSGNAVAVDVGSPRTPSGVFTASA